MGGSRGCAAGRRGGGGLCLALASWWALSGLLALSALPGSRAEGEKEGAKCNCEAVEEIAEEVSRGAMIAPVEVEEAQEAWAKGLIEIATLGRTESVEAARNYTGTFVGRLYGFGLEDHPVLVKPPMVEGKQFRTTREGVISAFAGGNSEFEDQGFALKGWKEARFENVGISLEGGEAMAMGNCLLTGANDTVTKLEYTFGYFRAPEGELRLNFQFFSLPYRDGTNMTESKDIRQEEVEKAIDAWGEEIKEIGKQWAYGVIRRGEEDAWEQAHRLAGEFVDTMYGYDVGNVLFKPADSLGRQFRLSREGAVSYFVGGNDKYKEDKGFALKLWDEFQFRNFGLILTPDRAFAMGEYIFTAEGERTEAQYAFGFVRDRLGRLRIDLLHASYPSNGKAAWDGSKSRLVAAEGRLSEADVAEAQLEYARGIVDVGAKLKTAAQFVDAHYAYATRPTLLKPAEAKELQFRTLREGAISYFGGPKKGYKGPYEEEYDEDRGFATHPWASVRFENAGVIVQGSQALAMGNAFFTEEDGKQRQAQFAGGYVRSSDGSLRMNLHHASFPPLAVLSSAARLSSSMPVTREQVAEAQKSWGDGVVEIGNLRDDLAKARARAKRLVDEHYGYAEGPVLFKPTEADEKTRFRLNRQGAVSYFVGSDPEFPADMGFAMRPWKQVRFKDLAITIEGSHALAIGQYFFHDPEGQEVRLEYSFAYFRDVDGRLKINLHYVSIPYNADYNSTWDGFVDGASNVKKAAEKAGAAVKSAEEAMVRTGKAHSNLAMPLLGALALCGLFLYFVTYWGRGGAGGGGGGAYGGGGDFGRANTNFEWGMEAAQGSDYSHVPSQARPMSVSQLGGYGQSQRPGSYAGQGRGGSPPRTGQTMRVSQLMSTS